MRISAIGLVGVLAGTTAASAQSYEACYLNTGTYPSDATNWWMYNGLEVQGVTNDGENWFFTLVKKDDSDGILRRIPSSVPLEGGPLQPPDPGIYSVAMTDPELEELADLGAWHWGDPDHFKYQGVDYILVPIPIGGDADNDIVACFLADDLTYVGYAYLDATYQEYAGWCAIGTGGDLYSSRNDFNEIIRYNVNWSALIGGSHTAITFLQIIPLYDSSGDLIEPMENMQGGEFSDSGESLFLVTGRGECAGNGEVTPNDAVHVFATSSWREQRRSLNTGDLSDPFAFEYNNGCACVAGSQTPEGVTYWDLDNGSVTGMRGQLHVLVDHYNFICDDAVSMKHFSHNLRVNGNNGYTPPTDPRTGTVSRPFETVNEAYDYYSIWNGARMVIQAGTYDDTGLYNKRIRMESRNGAALIGQQ